MKLIHGNEIQKSLDKIKPHSVAVAFVGIDWQTYIDITLVKEIIVSPTLGSNPYAIGQIAEMLEGGWANLHFLDTLHAKMYIGNHAVAIGSFNLTRNGLSGQNLEEAGVVLENTKVIDESNTLFAKLKSEAEFNYPSRQKKLNKLDKLITRWNRANAEKVIDSKPVQLENFFPQIGTEFYIGWVNRGEYIPDKAYNSVVIEKGIAAVSNSNKKISARDLIEDCNTFAESDDIKENRWLLIWETKSNENLTPTVSHMRWIYIHEVIPKGISHETYPEMAVEWKNVKKPPVPFELNKKIKEAIVNALKDPRFHKFLPAADGSTWYFKQTFPVFIDFIKAVRDQLTLPKNP